MVSDPTGLWIAESPNACKSSRVQCWSCCLRLDEFTALARLSRLIVLFLVLIAPNHLLLAFLAEVYQNPEGFFGGLVNTSLTGLVLPVDKYIERVSKAFMEWHQSLASQYFASLPHSPFLISSAWLGEPVIGDTNSG